MRQGGANVNAMEPATVVCQACHVPMRLTPSRLDLGPADWHPSDERLAAILAEVFHCAVCDRVAIRPGAVTSGRSRAAA